MNRFARVRRYTIGARLRDRAFEVVRRAFIAWRDRQRQLFRARELSAAIDELKLDLMLAQDVNAFRSDRECEAIWRLVRDLGKQCGGWLKELEKKGQDAPGNTPRQRAHALSGRSASAAAEANP